MADIDSTVAYARDKNLIVNVYLEDWSNGYRDSLDYVHQMAEALDAMDIAHVMLPDTLCVFSP